MVGHGPDAEQQRDLPLPPRRAARPRLPGYRGSPAAASGRRRADRPGNRQPQRAGPARRGRAGRPLRRGRRRDHGAEPGPAREAGPGDVRGGGQAPGRAPERAAVVEDAVVGVQAAEQGGFGLVAGIARQENRADLEAAGADLVVEDVGQLDLGVPRAGASTRPTRDTLRPRPRWPTATWRAGEELRRVRRTACTNRAPTWPGCTTG